jgi:uncharacterized protein
MPLGPSPAGALQSSLVTTPDPDLVQRLARYGVTLGVPAAPAPRPAPAHVLPIEVAVPGQPVANAHGACYVSVVRRGGDEVHGDERLGDALTTSTENLAALVGRQWCTAVDPARTAFLDTETTGLAGGTGTYAFLIGVGRFQDGAFHVRQFFMRDPSEERAQLAEVRDWVEGCTGLVTFNGRTFDMPLLGARYALHRLPPILAGAAHLDLLPGARRLWRRRLESCALTSLERHVLGLARVDDVPGWLIPERYLRYQADGDARPLVSVFHHNALDILSMVSLMTRMARACAEPERALPHAQDWLALACVHETRGAWAEVIAACDGALCRGLGPDEADEAHRRLASAARRLGDWARAVAVWRALVDDAAPRRLFPFEALAKYLEHHARPPDLAGALDHAERARALVASGAIRPTRGTRTALADLDHRIDRLRRRLDREP